jgi:outer membrane lipoprotein carrier protein
MRGTVERSALALLVLAAAAAPGRAAEADRLVERIQATYDGLRDLTAEFHQRSTVGSVGRTLEARGVLYLKRPGRMRWEYQAPEARLIVTDGKVLWMYTPDERQVLVQDLADAFAGSTPLAFLLGLGNLRRDFAVRPVEHAGTRQAGLPVLELRPRHPDPVIARVLVEVELARAVVTKATIFDQFGNTNVLDFSAIRLNVGLPDAQFAFAVPPGVEVIRAPRPGR